MHNYTDVIMNISNISPIAYHTHTYTPATTQMELEVMLQNTDTFRYISINSYK